MATVRAVPSQGVIEAGDVRVEYSTGRAPNGKYFALGSVYTLASLVQPPSQLICGTGPSVEAAVEQLRTLAENAREHRCEKS